MDTNKPPLAARNFPTAEEEAAVAAEPSRYAGPESAYRLAFTDTDFLLREELRPVRMQLELLKPEMMQQEQGIESTIVIFGSARIARDSSYYQLTEKIARLLSDQPATAPAARALPPALADAVLRFAADEGTTVPAIHLAAFVLTLWQHGAGDEFTLGVPLSTREAEITWLRRWDQKIFSLRTLAKLYTISLRHVTNITQEGSPNANKEDGKPVIEPE